MLKNNLIGTSLKYLGMFSFASVLPLFCNLNALAAVFVADWELIHMDVNNGQNATDLEFTVFQKEDNIEVLGWDYKLKQRAVDGGAVIVMDEGNSGLNNDADYREERGWGVNDLNHAANVRIDGLNIPFSTRLWLQTSLRLSSFNTLRKRDLQWSFDANPNPEPPADDGMPPDEGFSFSRPEDDPNNLGKYRVLYTITNDDIDRWFRVENLAFLNTDMTPIDEPEVMLAWDGWIPYSGEAFEVAPRTEVSFFIDNLDLRDWIYAKLDKQEIDGPGGANIEDPIPTIQIHETESTPEPTSTLSVLALGILGTASTLKRKLK